jgi:OOP family OmpA-OmpF porin
MRNFCSVMSWSALALTGLAFPADAAQFYTKEQMIEILAPMPQTRSLEPGTGTAPQAPEPGTAGSGRLPDLSVPFEFNSAELTPEAMSTLDELGAALTSNELADFRFEIAGHTDAVGSDSYNMDLSRRRAQAVVDYLVGNFGVDPSRLEGIGYGEGQLLDPDRGASQVNRRVEVVTQQ